MAEKYLIVVGDPTTGGGEAIQGDPGWVVEGIDGVPRPLVRVNDPVICGSCGPTKVVQGLAFFLSGGGLVAYDGCALACGHQMVARMQRLLSISVNDAPKRKSAVEPPWSEPLSASSPHGTEPFDEAFVLLSRDTGMPLTNRKYKVHRNGSIETGTTDGNGATHVIASSMAETVVIELQEEGP